MHFFCQMFLGVEIEFILGAVWKTLKNNSFKIERADTSSIFSLCPF